LITQQYKQCFHEGERKGVACPHQEPGFHVRDTLQLTKCHAIILAIIYKNDYRIIKIFREHCFPQGYMATVEKA
jgi:hypothetical protein